MPESREKNGKRESGLAHDREKMEKEKDLCKRTRRREGYFSVMTGGVFILSNHPSGEKNDDREAGVRRVQVGSKRDSKEAVAGRSAQEWHDKSTDS